MRNAIIVIPSVWREAAPAALARLVLRNSMEGQVHRGPVGRGARRVLGAGREHEAVAGRLNVNSRSRARRLTLPPLDARRGNFHTAIHEGGVLEAEVPRLLADQLQHEHVAEVFVRGKRRGARRREVPVLWA